MRPFERSELRVFEVAASITVTTVMLKTNVTARAMTSAKPRSCPNICRSRVMSDPRAVSQVDGVAQVVRVDRCAALQTDREVDLQRGETAAAGRVRERRECVRGGEVVGDLGTG